MPEPSQAVVCQLLPPQVWSLRSIDAALAEAIVAAASLAELRRVRTPFGERLPHEAEPEHLGTWMIWMVHRVSLDDPSLEVLNFSHYEVPSCSEEPRILPKLLSSLPHNSHLSHLCLADCGLAGYGLAESFAEALCADGGAVKVLDLSGNEFRPVDLQVIFSVLATNCTLETLRIADQFCELPVNFETFQTLHKYLKANTSLHKLGFDLTDAHWRDQITRCLLRNVDRVRRLRLGMRPSEGRRSSFSSEDGCS